MIRGDFVHGRRVESLEGMVILFRFDRLTMNRPFLVLSQPCMFWMLDSQKVM